jgi:uncharacterized integral membrane protein
MQDLKINMLICFILLCIATVLKAYQKRRELIFWAFTHPLEVMTVIVFLCAAILIMIYASLYII